MNRVAPRDPRARDLRSPVMLFALGFGSGLAPRGPGTAGTVVGVLLYLAIAPLPASLHATVLVLVVLAGIPVCGRAARRLGQHDHGAIVWDEIAGFLVTMIGLPSGPAWLVAGFAMFRVLDIAKPWPISWIDRRLSGGFGIMADDLLAGAAACVALNLVRLALGGP